ncbi:hypothetical protein Dimus_029199 [Dionaea muscipula]
MGWRTISGGATLIGRLYQGIGARARRDKRFRTEDDRTFDLVGTAFAYGISIEDLERRLAARRRQTAALAYSMFGLACLFVLAWVCVALRVANGAAQLSDQEWPGCRMAGISIDRGGVSSTMVSKGKRRLALAILWAAGLSGCNLPQSQLGSTSPTVSATSTTVGILSRSTIRRQTPRSGVSGLAMS